MQRAFVLLAVILLRSASSLASEVEEPSDPEPAPAKASQDELPRRPMFGRNSQL